MATIFRKTRKGQVEVEARVNRLAQRLRAALIMVDGRRTDEQLFKLLPVDPTETLHILLEAGYIEVASEQGSSLDTEAGAALAPLPESRPWPEDPAALHELRQLPIRYLTDQLGPLAEAPVRQIEQAQGWDAFQLALAAAYQQLTHARGSAVAEEFRQRLLDRPLAG